MRVGIDYRILRGGPAAAVRGMARYTQQQLREVLAAGSDDEYLLLCDAETDQSLILPDIRSAPNVEVRLIPAEATTDLDSDERMLYKGEIFERWLAAQQLDLYHCTAPFFLDQLIVAQHDACPYVATVYDLIPLVYPAQYLAPPKLRQRYLLATALVTRATRLLAISESARRDVTYYLGVQEDRIDVAPPFAEPFFRPMDADEVAVGLAPLAARLGLGQPYIFSVADLHFTKNVETLVRGYALLPDTIRKASPLVIACELGQDHADYLTRLAAGLGVDDRVSTTGLVPDAQLSALYNGATFVVHPSRYEGFGLPVLEAMQCGTPVITTTSSSLPEVAGDACVLVEPDDAPALAAAMEALWDDPSERDRMRERGLSRASVYTGPALAQATLAGYAKARVAPENSGRPRIALWSPRPPLDSGVADLEAGLAAQYDVDVFVEGGYLPPLELLLSHDVRHYRAFDRLAGRFAAVVSPHASSEFHRQMGEAVLQRPGTVVHEGLHGLGELPVPETHVDRQRPVPVPDGRLNKVCDIEDFSDAALFSLEMAGLPASSKEWRTAMALRTLREGGALRGDAVILGVGAGTGDIAFHLTRHVAKVIATDQYLRPGAWSAGAPPAMLVDPSSVAPFPFDESRLFVRHMDGRVLGFDDDTFDGIYSSGSIHRLGELEDIASAAYEMGRVLKPEGVLSVSTELLLSGPPGGRGTPDTPLLSAAQVLRYIVEASGLEPVDEVRLTPSQATLASPRDLLRPESQRLIGVTDGYVFGTLHLALRKTAGYPAAPNGWARPSPALRRTVDSEIRQVVATAPAVAAEAGPAPVGPPEHRRTVPRSWPAIAASAEQLAASGETQNATVSQGTARMGALRLRVDETVASLRREEAYAVACFAEFDAANPLVDGDREAAHGTGWRWCRVALPGGTEVGVMVDSNQSDESAEEILSGEVELDWPALLLLGDLVDPGDVVVDIGAGSGLFTLAAAAAGCRVVALEPSRAKVALLRASVAGNGYFDTLAVNMSAAEAAVDVLLGELGVDTVALVRLSAGNANIAALLGMYNVLVGPAPPCLLFSSDGTEVGAELESLGFRLVRLDRREETGASVYLAVHALRESLAHLGLTP